MNLIELKDKLYWKNVPDRWYSLDEGLKPDACILYKNYAKWEFFYLDKKGDRHEFKVFSDVDDAYDHFWQKMEYQLEVFRIKPKDR